MGGALGTTVLECILGVNLLNTPTLQYILIHLEIFFIYPQKFDFSAAQRQLGERATDSYRSVTGNLTDSYRSVTGNLTDIYRSVAGHLTPCILHII